MLLASEQKLLMYLLFTVYGAGRNDFDAGNIHYKGHIEGVGPENRDFLGPLNGNERSPKKSRYIKYKKLFRQKCYIFVYVYLTKAEGLKLRISERICEILQQFGCLGFREN